jgi:hypothetical protein
MAITHLIYRASFDSQAKFGGWAALITKHDPVTGSLDSITISGAVRGILSPDFHTRINCANSTANHALNTLLDQYRDLIQPVGWEVIAFSTQYATTTKHGWQFIEVDEKTTDPIAKQVLKMAQSRMRGLRDGKDDGKVIVDKINPVQFSTIQGAKYPASLG